MRIVMVYRRRRPDAFSIEELFHAIAAERGKDSDVTEYEIGGLWHLLKDVWRLRKMDADIYHITGDINYFAPLVPKTKTVLTVHDIGHYLFGLKGIKRRLYRWLWLTWPIRVAETVLGFRNPEDIPPIFAAADVFVLPSRHDGWGVVVNEALGAGLPIIASDRTGAAHDLVQHGVNGFVTGAGDVEALVANPAQDFGETSRTLAEGWGLTLGVDRWLDLCRQLLASQSAA
jgi:glycosyltransferase involved in cell wall biosynthesis